MRSTFTILAFTAALASAGAAHAERRMFIVSNNAGGYGVDRCLATGAACGAAIATSYCRTHEFRKAVAYRKVEKSDITGAVSTGDADACRGRGCEEFVAIECTR
jgi:hypothetical protein